MKPLTKQTVKTASKFVTIGLLIGLLIGAFIAYGQSPSSTFTISSGVYPGAPSYTIWTEGSEYFAKDANGLIAYSGTNASQIITSVFALAKSVLFKTATYTISSTIFVLGSKSLVIYGEDMDTTILKNDAITTCMIALGDGVSSSNDYSGKLVIKNLQIHGNDKNLNLIEVKNLVTHPSGILMESTHFIGFGTGGGIACTNNIFIEDSSWIGCKFSFGGFGIEVNFGDNNFYSCQFGYLARGIRIWGNGGVNVYGGLFTHNVNDIYLNESTATDYIISQNFYGVWFEDSTDTIISTDSSTHNATMTFTGCHFHTYGNYTFYFAYDYAWMTFIGGDIDLTGGHHKLVSSGVNVTAINFPDYDDLT